MTAIMRLLLLLLLLLPTACAAAPDRSAGGLAEGVLLPGELPAADETVTLVGLLLGREQRLLAAGPLPDGAVPLAPLPAHLLDNREQLSAAAAAVPVEIRGRLTTVVGGRLLTALELDVVTPRVTRLDELAALSGPRLVQIEAALLAATGSYLLVTELTDGGVPTAASLQFKLRLTEAALVTMPPLQTTGTVGFAPVTVLALWRDGLLTGLTVSARAKP